MNSSDTPTLTNEQKLVLLNHAKDVEIATLKMQRCQDILDRYVATVVPAGYELLNTLELREAPKSETQTTDQPVS